MFSLKDVTIHGAQNRQQEQLTPEYLYLLTFWTSCGAVDTSDRANTGLRRLPALNEPEPDPNIKVS